MKARIYLQGKPYAEVATNGNGFFITPHRPALLQKINGIMRELNTTPHDTVKALPDYFIGLWSAELVQEG